MAESLILRETQGAIAVLTLNRPERRNSLSRGLVAALSDALSAVAADTTVRAVVLTGAGESFCTGMDLKQASETTHDAEGEKQVIDDVSAIADIVHLIHAIPKPMIAALNGDTYAGGAGIMAACDFVIASGGSKIGYPEVKRGLVAAVIMNDLVRQVGERRARELVLLGDPITVELAQSWGLVNRVVPRNECLSTAIALARSLMANGPNALAVTKRLLDDSGGKTGDLRGAAAVTASIFVSDEAAEGIRAFMEKRPPSWALERESGS